MLGICPLSLAFLTLYEVQSEFQSRWFIWVGEKRIREATNDNFYFAQCPHSPQDAHLAFVHLQHLKTFQSL